MLSLVQAVTFSEAGITPMLPSTPVRRSSQRLSISMSGAEGLGSSPRYGGISCDIGKGISKSKFSLLTLSNYSIVVTVAKSTTVIVD